MGAKNIDRVHWIFGPIEPFIEKMSTVVEAIHLANGQHWVLTIAATSLLIRFCLLPIFYLHSKRVAKVANKIGIFKLLQHIYKTTSLTKHSRLKNLCRLVFRSSRQLKLKPFNIVLYYAFMFPFITSTIFGLRKVMGCATRPFNPKALRSRGRGLSLDERHFHARRGLAAAGRGHVLL